MRDELAVQPVVAALGWTSVRRDGTGFPAVQLVGRDAQFDASLTHAQRDDVACLNETQRTARGGVRETCSTIVPNAVPLMRASETRTMSLTPARASFLGIGR